MVYIIAEIGCNHNGDIKLAKEMVDAAVKCGVDAVKFQTFKAEKLISKHAPKAEYQKRTTGEEDSQLEMTKKLELSFDEYLEMKEYCQNKGVDVFSTAFDFESLDFLISTDMPVYKIPSGEITNLPYLEIIGKQGKKVILSTGMATIEEIKTAIKILEESGSDDISILHCTTDYPTKYEDVNLNVITTMKSEFTGYEIGYSDHSLGAAVSTAAVALGSTIVEKHFTTDNNLPGPDQEASANPEVLEEMVRNIRIIEKSMGSFEKVPTKIEVENRVVARKSLVASAPIKKGEVFTEDNLTVKRPGNGISPMEWYNYLGTESNRDYDYDELIEPNHEN